MRKKLQRREREIVDAVRRAREWHKPHRQNGMQRRQRLRRWCNKELKREIEKQRLRERVRLLQRDVLIFYF
jgi:hypothetical protein